MFAADRREKRDRELQELADSLLRRLDGVQSDSNTKTQRAHMELAAMHAGLDGLLRLSQRQAAKERKNSPESAFWSEVREWLEQEVRPAYEQWRREGVDADGLVVWVVLRCTAEWAYRERIEKVLTGGNQ